MDQEMSDTDLLTLKDEVVMLKDKVAHLQSQLEQSENEAVLAAEFGQKLLEEKEYLEAVREEERISYTAKIEELTQENFNLTAKVESGARLLEAHSQEHENEDKFKSRIEQEKEEIRISYEKKLSDMKKIKLASDEELSQVNLKLQQKEETIEDLHKVIAEQKSKNKILEGNTCLEGEMQELKSAFQDCYEEKCQIEENMKECMHMLQTKSLEVENLTKRMNELNDELEYAQKEQVDSYKHLEDANNTITELRVEISQLETELNSRGHSKKGNSLFGELEDKRVVAERNLAIFKVRYDSLQKAHAAAKNEILKMKNQVLAFLQTRSDRADRLRIEYLERAVTEAKSECNRLTAMLKQREQQLLAKDPLVQIKEMIQSCGGVDKSKEYINMLTVTAEEYKNKTELLTQELKTQKLANIAKSDELLDTQRKLYTATNTSDKNRNENLRGKIRLEEMKNKFEAEKRKRLECEDLIKKLSSDDKTAVSNIDVQEKQTEKSVLKTENVSNKSKSREDRKRKKDFPEENSRTTSDPTPSYPEKVIPREMTDEEKRDKANRLMRMFLPKELAEEYVRQNENRAINKGHEQNNKPTGVIARKTVNKVKTRKVSFKDEVEGLENDQKHTTELTQNDKKISASSKKIEDGTKDPFGDDEKREDCKVQ